MSSVDNRIVRMQFDNGKFESAVQTTMSTLDRLKSALKFDKSKANSLEEVGKSAKKMDLSKISSDVEQLNSKFSVLGVAGATAISHLTTSLIGLGKKLFNLSIGGGIKRALNIEQAKFTIEGLGESFEKLRDDINYAVEGTAYGFDEAAKAASAMSASGIKAGNDMKTSLRSISGMAAMTGSSYSDIADIFTTVAGNGRVLSMQLNQLSSRGVNAAAILTKYANKNDKVRESMIKAGLASKQASKVQEFADATQLTEQNIRTLVSSSAIDFKTFSKAMDDAFGEHAKAANKTFTGVISNIKASLSRLSASFILPAIETNDRDSLLTGEIENYDDTLEKLANTAKRSNSAVKDARAQFIAQAKEMPQYANKSEKELGKLYNKYSKFNWNLTTVLQGVQRMFSAFEGVLKKSNFLQGFFNVLRSASKSLSLLTNAIAASLNGPIEIVESIGKKGAEKTKKYLVGSEKLWERFRISIGLSVTDFKNLGDTFKGLYSIFDLFATIVSEALKALLPTKTVVGGFASILLSVTGAIGRFLTATVNLIKHSKIISVVFGAIGIVLKIIAGVFRLAASAVSLFITALSDNIILSGFVTALHALISAILGLFNAFKSLGSIIINAIVSPFKKMSGSVSIINSAASGVLKVLSDLFWFLADKVNQASKAVSDFAESKAFKAINDISSKAIKKIAKAWDGLINIFSGKVDIGAVFSNIGGGLVKGFSNIRGMIANFSLGDIFSIESSYASSEGMQGKIEKTKNVLNDFLKFLNRIKERIKDAFVNIGNAIKEVNIDPKEIALTIAGGIVSGLKIVSTIIVALGMVIFDALKSAFSNIFNNIKNGLPKPNVLGVAIGDFLTKGISSVLKIIPILVEIIASAIRTLISNIPGIINNLGKEIGSALDRALFQPIEITVGKSKRVIPSLFDTVGGTVSTAVKKVISLINDASLTDILEAIQTGLIAKILALMGKVQKSKAGFLDNVGNSISNFFNSTAKGIDSYLKAENKIKNMNAMANLIKNLAISLAILAGSLVILSFIPTENLIKGGIALGALAAGLLILVVSLTKLNDSTKGSVAKVAQSLSALAGSFLLLSLAVAILGKLKMAELMQGIIAVTVGLAGITYVLSEVAGKSDANPKLVSAFANSLAKVSVSMLILAVALKLLSSADPVKLAASLLGLVWALGAMVGSLILLNKFGGGSSEVTKIAKGLIILSAAVTILAISLKLLSGTENLWSSLMVLSLALASLAAAAIAISKLNATDTLIPLAVAISALGVSFAILGSVPFEGIKGGLIAIGGALAALTIATLVISRTGLMGVAILKALGLAVLALGVGMGLAGAGALAFAAAITMMSNISSDGLNNLKNVISTLITFIPEIVVAIAQGIIQVLGVLAAAGPQLVMTATVLVTSFAMGIANSTGAISAAAMKLLVSLLTTIAANIYQVTVLAAQIIVGFINGIAEMLPQIVTAALNLMTQFINGLALGIEQNGPKIRAAVANLLASIINFTLDSFNAIFGKIPVIGKKISSAVSGAKKQVNNVLRDGKTAAAIDSEARAGTKAFDKNMKTLVKNAKKSGGDVKKNFSNEVKKMYPDLNLTTKELNRLWDKYSKSSSKSVDKASKNIKKSNKKGLDEVKKDTKRSTEDNNKILDKFGDSKGFLNNAKKNVKNLKGMAGDFKAAGKGQGDSYKKGIESVNTTSAGNTIKNKAKKGASGGDFFSLGQNVSIGYANGVTNKSGTVYDAVRGVVKQAYKEGKKAQKSKSPSKLYRQLGDWAIEGYAMGMYETEKMVTDAATTVVKNTANSVQILGKRIFSDIGFDDISDPVIRPVLDLSDVRSGVNTMGSMLDSEYSTRMAGTMAMQNPRLVSYETAKPTETKIIEFKPTININGADDPKYWADEFMLELDTQARKY